MASSRIAILLGILLWSLAGCAKGPESEIIGVWREGGKAGALWSFRADGSLAIAPINGGRESYATWKLVDATLSIRDNRSGQNMESDLISVGKNELNLREKKRSGIATLTRVSDSPTPPSRAELAANTPAGRRVTEEEDRIAMSHLADKAVLNNARQLAAASDQYFLEHGVTSVRLSDLVGPNAYIKSLFPIANEKYPSAFTQGVTITVTGIAGARTITYAP
jgi:hypothetical protein